MKKSKCLTKQVLAFVLMGVMPFVSLSAITAYADTEIYTAVDGNQISAERLQDNLVEYDELGSLIYANNESIKEMTDSTERTRANYEDIRDYLKTEKSTASMKKGEAKSSGNMDDYADYASMEAVYGSAIKSYNKSIEKLDRYSTNKNRLALEKQLTISAQSLMVSYQSTAMQKDYMTKMENLYHTQYNVAQKQVQAGLATSQEVLAAYNNWQSASVSLNSLVTSEESIYQSLCSMLGLEEGNHIQISSIPSANLSKISAMDLEADTTKAIGSNADLVSARNTSSGKTTSGINQKGRTLDELEEQVKITMQQLYETVMQAKISYDAAKVGASSAEITWTNAKNKYSMGMLSQTGYLQEEINYTQKMVEYQAADMSLLQAIEAYYWAVNGIVDLN